MTSYWTGKKMSEETKRKMSLAHKGKKKPWVKNNGIKTRFKKGVSSHPSTQFKKGQNAGKNNPRYTGYIHKKYKIKVIEWKIIRQIVLERDGFICQECGKSDCLLDVHHIKPYRISNDNSIDNLITLCRSCHSRIEYQIMLKYKGGGSY